MDNPELKNPPETKEEDKKTSTSFLDGILAATKQESTTEKQKEGEQTAATAGSPNVPKKPREPLSMATVLKAIGSLIIVSIIFFGSFLAYIVFNPDQAYFFVNIFGINPSDIASLLKKLINGSFGAIIFLLSIVWIIALFRAIWTPKELKRKRLLGWMTAALVGIILFSVLAFWAYLFSKLSKIDFTNLSGTVIVYDDTLYTNDATRDISRLGGTTNLIGPITLKFDISENARQTQATNSVKITKYTIDFNGALCNDGRTIVTGANPLGSDSIVCTFDTIKNYNISGTYTANDLLGKEVSIPMDIRPVEIRGLVTIQERKNKDSKSIITIDASNLRNLGTPRWEYKSNGKIVNEDSVTEEPTSTPNIIYFYLFGTSVDRIFLIQTTKEKGIGGVIDASQDEVNPLDFKFQVKDLTVNTNLITKVEWSLDDGSLICRENTDLCEFTFSSYVRRKVRANVFLASGENFTLEKEINIEEPLLLTRHAVVTDSNGKLLNPQSSFDVKLKSYIIRDIFPPATLTFDARDLVVENLGYRLTNVLWSFDDGKTVEEKKGERVTFTVNNNLRYTVIGTYTFSKSLLSGDDVKVIRDSITIDVERTDLIPRMNIQSTSDYVPAHITVDGSESKSSNGEIVKFIYNFGDGKPDATGDAVQEYEYTTPGNKEITLTVIDTNGNSASIKSVVVLKEAPKTADFIPSISPGAMGSIIDFTANANGQIDDYIWSFGDNTPALHGYEVSHTFTKPGTYNISLTVVYSDGTRKTASKDFLVVESLN